MLAEHEEQLSKAALLEPNWNSYGSERPNSVAIANARKIIGLCDGAGVIPARIVPDADGGMAVTFFENEKHSYIAASNDSSMVAAMFDYRPMDEPIAWELDASTEQINSALARIVEYLKRTD